MTNELSALWEKRPELVHGWSLSVVFHGVVGGVALFAMTNILVVQQSEPFTLNMSILKPPPRPVAQQMVAQTPATESIVKEKRLERPPIEQQVVHRPKTFEPRIPEPQAIQSQPVQQMTQPVIALDSVEHTIVKVQQSESSPVTDRQTIRRAAIQPVAVVSSNEKRVVESMSPRFEHISAIVTEAMSRSASRMQQPPVQSLVASQTVASVQSVSRRVIHRSVVTEVQPSVVTREVKQDPTSTADYSWVGNSLSEKVLRLKRYPSRAKKRKWEGTVN